MSNYRQAVDSARTHFSRAPMGELEFSTMYTPHRLLTTFNGGDIVPIYCGEVLPHDTWEMNLNAIIRQSTVLTPTMGNLRADFYAFFVPNRVVNDSWKNVMGENTSGMWTAPQVSLATLGTMQSSNVHIPVGSVADYYGLPTQGVFTRELMSQMHDLKFRGYLSIYNNYFRNQNYMPPIPFSKLNVFNGFLTAQGSQISVGGTVGDYGGAVGGTSYYKVNLAEQPADGSFPKGALTKAIAGDGGELNEYAVNQNPNAGLYLHRKTSWSALNPPLKATKFHDYFTSVLPDSQKGRAVSIPIFGEIPLNTYSTAYTFGGNDSSSWNPLVFKTSDGLDSNAGKTLRLGQGDANNGYLAMATTVSGTGSDSTTLSGTNMFADLNSGSVQMSIEQIRMSSAIQQVYEILGRSGSRYIEYINAFFGIDVENPFDDIPTYLGHFSRDLDLYQTAQTSATTADGGTPQGTLSAYGYTDKGGKLFTRTFKEHGYVHVFCVVRHRNLYSSYLGRDNFRLSMMDFYQYPLANISEQPVYTREINPFASDKDGVFGYQEAWAELRYEPDRTSGMFRSQLPANQEEDLTEWNYADTYDPNLQYANGSWLLSNTAEVVARTTALSEREYPQFKAQFDFSIKKERPLPVYSVPGMDIF